MTAPNRLTLLALAVLVLASCAELTAARHDHDRKRAPEHKKKDKDESVSFAIFGGADPFRFDHLHLQISRSSDHRACTMCTSAYEACPHFKLQISAVRVNVVGLKLHACASLHGERARGGRADVTSQQLFEGESCSMLAAWQALAHVQPFGHPHGCSWRFETV